MPLSVLPDVAVAGLYYARLELTLIDAVHGGSSILTDAVQTTSLDVDLIILEIGAEDVAFGVQIALSDEAGTVLVAEGGVANKRNLRHVIAALEDVGGLVLGAVFVAPPNEK